VKYEYEERRAYRFDWKMAAVTIATIIGQGAIQYGVVTTKMSDLERRMERVEQKIDDRMLPREEFEKRHEDLRKLFEELRERVQQLEMQRLK
jgi:predicted nuclease with TOPRIM domain